MQITNEIIAKVFAQYFGQKLQFEKQILNGYLLEQIQNGNLNGEKLILKPLSKITDEDMIWVYDTCNNLHQERKLRPELVKQNSMSLQEMKLQINIEHNHWLKNTWVYQYLLSKGYDLPQFLLGYKTLHESGLAVYE